MSKKIIILVLAIIVIGGGFYAYNKREAKAPTSSEITPPASQGNDMSQTVKQEAVKSASTTPSAASTNAPKTKPGSTDTSTAHYSSGEEGADGGSIQVLAVVYNGTSFDPVVTDLKVNDWIFFRNESTKAFWPQIDSAKSSASFTAFDAQKNIAPGGEFKLQFTKAGTFVFKDHLNPSITGTVTVSAN